MHVRRVKCAYSEAIQSVFALLKLRRTRFALRSSQGCATRSPKGEAWWAVTDSNRRHSACKADALPTELTAQVNPQANPPWRDLSPRCRNAQVRRCGDAARRRP